MKHAAVVAITLSVVGCEKQKTPTPEAAQDAVAVSPPQNAAPPAAAPAELKLLDFDPTAVPQPVGVKDGKVAHGLRFTDANGENLVVLWSDADQGLWAKHVIINGDAVVRELREVKQVRGDCEFDYSAGFVSGSLRASDLNADGFAEVAFAYKYACRSDMSPQDYKVLVLENGEKSILRGSEILVHDGAEPIGDGKFEPEGFDGRPELLEHATTIWKRNVVTQY